MNMRDIHAVCECVLSSKTPQVIICSAVFDMLYIFSTF